MGDPVNAVDPSGYGCIIASGVLADDGGGCISTGKLVYGDGTINPDGNTQSVSATLTFPAVEPDTLNSFAQQAFTMVGNNYVLIIPSFGIGASLGVDAYGGLGPGTYGFSEQASAGGGIYFDGHSDSLTAGAFLEGGGNPGIPTGIWPGTAPSDAGPNFNFGVGQSVGPSLFLTNSATVVDQSGPFMTTLVNTGPLGLTFEYDSGTNSQGQQIGVLSVGVSDCVICIGVASFTTYTITTPAIPIAGGSGGGGNVHPDEEAIEE